MNRLSLVPAAVIAVGLASCSSGGNSSGALPSISAVAPAPVTTEASPTSAPSTTAPSSTAPSSTAPSSTAPSSTAPNSSPASSSALPSAAAYTDARFGFSVTLPKGFHASSKPPVDGDGQEFFSDSGPATFTVFGVNNNNHESVDAFYAGATAPRSGVKVTYANKSGDVVTVSGVDGSSVFYERDTVGPGSIDTLRWSYPVADKATYDPLLVATVRSDRAGDVSQSH